MSATATQWPLETMPALRRLEALTPLDHEARTALLAAADRARTVPARRELLSEGQPIHEPVLILEGWAARVRQLADGRRQIIGFLLPGDIVGNCGYPSPSAMSTVVGFTSVTLCPLPDASRSPTLERAYAISRAMDEAHLMAQVTRLGRLNAYERIADFLLETFERLALAGLTVDQGFTMPLTQETLADTLGLTAVHVNRTLQQGRRAGELDIVRGSVRLCRPEAMARIAGRRPTRVTRPDPHP